MDPNRFATLLLVAGSAIGLASANLVPTRAVSAPASYPSASPEDYPEITAISYENIPGPVAPVIRRGSMPLHWASWQKPWLEPPPLPPEPDYPRFEEDGGLDYGSSGEEAEPPGEHELVDLPVEISITLADHP